MKLKQEDKQKLINHIESKIEKLKDDKKIKLDDDIILELFFTKETDRTGRTYYIQDNIPHYFNKIDLSKVIKKYHHRLNIIMGANCKNSNIDFNVARSIFLNPILLIFDSLEKIDIFNNINNIPDTDLSNNDFSENIFNLRHFLETASRYIREYVAKIYYPELKYIIDRDYNNMSNDDKWKKYLNNYISKIYYSEYKYDINKAIGNISSDDPDTIIWNKMHELEKKIIKKIIPNLKNTGLNIVCDDVTSFSPYIYEAIYEVLESGKFDGCYIDIFLVSKNNPYGERLYYQRDLFNYEDHIKKLIKKSSISEENKQQEYNNELNGMYDSINSSFQKKIK